MHGTECTESLIGPLCQPPCCRALVVLAGAAAIVGAKHQTSVGRRWFGH